MTTNGSSLSGGGSQVQQRDDVGSLVDGMRAELAVLAQELAAVEAAAGVPKLQQSGFVPADQLDPVIEGLRAEIAALATELASVEHAAATAEEALAGAKSRPANGRTEVGTASDAHELEATVAAMRTAGEMEISAALDHAHAHAAARIAQAEAQARSIRAGGMPAFDLDDDDDRSIDIVSVPSPMALVPPPAPATREVRRPEPVATAPMAVVSPAPSPAADSIGDPQPTSQPAPQKLSPIPLEALLPMVALVLLLLVVLAWLG